MENTNKEMQFTTNINCGGCVAKIKPHLDVANGVCLWNVDTANKEKILTVKSTGITEQEIIETVEKAGFKITPLNK